MPWQIEDGVIVEKAGFRILPSPSNGSQGIAGISWALTCCGLGTVQGLSSVSSFKDFQEKADWLATLYRRMYACAHVIYSISDYQSGKRTRSYLKTTVSPAHAALLEIGSKQIAEFPNLDHGPCMVELWLVNVRDGVGLFYNKYGEPFTEPPKEVPPPHVWTALTDDGFSRAQLPKRPYNEQPTIAPTIQNPCAQPF